MKNPWLISVILLALVVETVVTNPVRERVRRASRDRCRNRFGCYSAILNKVHQPDDPLISDFAAFPTLRTTLQNPGVEEFEKDLTYSQEILRGFKLQLSTTANTPEDDKDHGAI